jgi:hypothetical protein
MSEMYEEFLQARIADLEHRLGVAVACLKAVQAVMSIGLVDEVLKQIAIEKERGE